jgi:hypothetical protein
VSEEAQVEVMRCKGGVGERAVNRGVLKRK